MRRDAEQQLRQRGEQFKTLLDQAPLGVYLVDADFRLREVNPIAKPVFDSIEGGVIGRDFDEVLHVLLEGEHADEIEGIFRRTLGTGEPYVANERFRTRENQGLGDYYDWRVDRIILPDGRFGVVCYFQDVSAQVIARKSLEESREALRDADRRKDEFLATLAHELRNPLAPLRNSLEIMKRSRGNSDLIERSRVTMERQLSHMVRLIDDLLDVSRITRNQLLLRREMVDFASIIHRALETCRPLADAAEHELRIALPTEPISLHADPARLAQVFGNLLTNACKFTERRGLIELSAEVLPGEPSGERPTDREIVVKIRDSGVGIPPEMLGKVFEMFAQVDRSLERSRGGLGIGLTLVKRLVELHGGVVTAHSEGPGTGSEFTVRLPVATGAGMQKIPGFDPEPATATSRRILIVDDNEDAASSLETLLKIGGNATLIAHDGQQALRSAAAFRPDIVLLDIGMPGMSGYATCRAMRERPWGKDILIAALTGWGQDEDRRKSKEAGFDAHMVKPVDYAAVVKLLASLSPDQEPQPTT
jgi:signal transduction histidine kinase/CheY-like chemotaxis protein